MKRFIPFVKPAPLVAVVSLNGVISAGRGLNDAGLSPVLEKAFRRSKPAAVALAINSPGGSAVQSSLIAKRIRRLAEEKDVPVYAFVEDVAASGGYWLACAANEIYVDESSIVGSIGVISAGFGLNQLIERHGIERRVHTAGTSKSFMDPFLPEKPIDVKRLKALQASIHQAFIDHVRSRRGDRLNDQEELFGGEIWVGQKAIDAGVADHIGHLVPTMKTKLGDKVKFARYGQRRGLLTRFGLSLLQDSFNAFEERALRARYGL
ncbi:MAG: S49 family peptidase [Pseudomonadota bacterium]